MSWILLCMVPWLFADGTAAHSQGLSAPDSMLVSVLSAIPDAAWSTNIYHRDWLKFPVNHTLSKPTNLARSQHLSPSKIQCAIDLLHTVSSLKEKWALQMIDAAAKPESGILNGRFVWTGSYEECLDVSAPPGLFSSGYKGQYCWLAFSPKISNVNVPLKIGICLPSSCDSKQMMNSSKELSLFLSKIPVVNKLVETVPLTEISCLPETVTWSTSAIGCLVFVGFLAVIVIIATAFDLVLRPISKPAMENSLVHESNNISESEIPVSHEQTSKNEMNISESEILVSHEQTSKNEMNISESEIPVSHEQTSKNEMNISESEIPVSHEQTSKNEMNISESEILVSHEQTSKNEMIISESEILVSHEQTSKNEMNISESEILVSHEQTNAYKDVLLCFSAAKNGSAILDISARKGQLDCIHGIRFLSMTWVILGHTFLFSVAQIANTLEIVKIMDLFSFQAALQAPFSVDSFFLLSGFLLTFLFLKDGASPKSFGGWIYFYVHRYIRLTPVYAILVGFWASVWNYLGSGPFWQYDRPETAACDQNWWANLLYVNNFFSVTKMCLAWSWYLSNDMQFYIISPLFLIPLKRWPIVGFSLISVTLLASWITTFLISYGHYFSLMFKAGGGFDMGDPNNPLIKQFDLIYIKPYCRIGPFLVGMLVAYCLSVTKSRRGSMSKWLVALGWMSATACGLVLVYGTYHSNLDTVGSGFFTALSRSAWALSLGWVIFACLSGYGGPVNAFLSMKYFFPLSRLTYCAYLIHPMIIYWYFGTLQDTIYLSLTNIVMLYLAFLLLSYGIAFVASLLFESPVVALEKQLRKMFQKKY